MSSIPMRDYVASGMVAEKTVNELLALGGEPMLSDRRDDPHNPWRSVPFRAWMRYSRSHRTHGPLATTAQLAADGLIAMLGDRR